MPGASGGGAAQPQFVRVSREHPREGDRVAAASLPLAREWTHEQLQRMSAAVEATKTNKYTDDEDRAIILHGMQALSEKFSSDHNSMVELAQKMQAMDTVIEQRELFLEHLVTQLDFRDDIIRTQVGGPLLQRQMKLTAARNALVARYRQLSGTNWVPQGASSAPVGEAAACAVEGVYVVENSSPGHDPNKEEVPYRRAQKRLHHRHGAGRRDAVIRDTTRREFDRHVPSPPPVGALQHQSTTHYRARSPDYGPPRSPVHGPPREEGLHSPACSPDWYREEGFRSPTCSPARSPKHHKRGGAHAHQQEESRPARTGQTDQTDQMDTRHRDRSDRSNPKLLAQCAQPSSEAEPRTEPQDCTQCPTSDTKRKHRQKRKQPLGRHAATQSHRGREAAAAAPAFAEAARPLGASETDAEMEASAAFESPVDNGGPAQRALSPRESLHGAKPRPQRKNLPNFDQRPDEALHQGHMTTCEPNETACTVGAVPGEEESEVEIAAEWDALRGKAERITKMYGHQLLL